MKRCSHIILTCIALSAIVLAQKLQAYNLQANNLVFATNNPQSSAPQITVTASQSRSRTLSPMAGKSNQSTVQQNHNFVPAPDLKNSTK